MLINLGNGICDYECITESCGFDDGDCDVKYVDSDGIGNECTLTNPCGSIKDAL